jgi:hypothetical protein
MLLTLHPFFYFTHVYEKFQFLKFKQDLRHAFSGWKIVNARLASKYLCTSVNHDALDQGLHIASLTDPVETSFYKTKKRKATSQ